MTRVRQDAGGHAKQNPVLPANQHLSLIKRVTEFGGIVVYDTMLPCEASGKNDISEKIR